VVLVAVDAYGANSTTSLADSRSGDNFFALARPGRLGYPDDDSTVVQPLPASTSSDAIAVVDGDLSPPLSTTQWPTAMFRPVSQSTRTPEAIFESLNGTERWRRQVAYARPFVASELLDASLVTARLQAELQDALRVAGITEPQTQRSVYTVAVHRWERELSQPLLLSDLIDGDMGDSLPALNLTRLEARRPQPLDILRIVHFRHGASMQDVVSDDYRLNGTRNDPLTTEAALLYERVSLATRLAPDTPVAVVVHRFISALEQHVGILRAGYLLLPPSTPAELGPWFDGMAVRDAQDQTVAALASALVQDTTRIDNLRAQCIDERIAWALPASDASPEMTRDGIETLLRARLAELAENADYPFGTPLQSMATILMRLGPAHGIEATGLHDANALVTKINRLASDWKDQTSWPVDPLLVSAAHMLTASTPSGAMGNATALHTLLANEASGADGANATSATRQQQLTQLWERFEQRLRAYDRLPVFNETHEAEQILLRLGFTASELSQPVRAALHVGPPSRLGVGATLATPVQHLLHSVKTRFPIFFHGPPLRRIDGFTWMKNALKQFNEYLQAHAKMPAKINELIRLAGVENSLEMRASAVKLIVTVNNLSARAESLEPPDWLLFIEATHDFLKRLTIAVPMFYVVEQVEQKNWRAVAEMVPFLVPAWEIGEGVVLRNFTEFRKGVIGLGVDAFMACLTHTSQRFLTRNMERAFAETMRMSPSHRSAISMLDMLSEPLADHGSDARTTDISLANFDFLSQDAISASSDSRALGIDPYDVFVDPAQLPKNVRRLPSIKRLDERPRRTTRDEPSFELIFNEDIELFASRTPPFEPIVPSPPHTHLSPVALGQQPTVVDIKRWVEGSRRVSLTDAMRILNDYVSSRPPLTGRILSDLMTSTSDAGRAVIAQLEALAEKSPTFRAIIDRATLPENGQPWKLEVADGFEPKVQPDAGRIWLCTDKEFGRKHYLTQSGTTPFSPERGWLHECLHALTDLDDPVDASEHRGAIVYLTDRIGFEVGWRYDERVIYRSSSSSGSSVKSPEHSHPSGGDGPVEPVSDDVVARMHDENRYLDRMLDRQMNLRPSTHALTQDVTSRATVADGLRLEQTLRFERLWVTSQRNPLTSPDLHAPGRLLGANAHLSEVSQRLISRSRLFRFLYQRWAPGDKVGAWRIVARAESEMPGSSGGSTHAPWRIHRALGEIEMHSGPVYYLSSSGPRYMTMTHRTVGALTELMTGDLRIRPVEDATVERGLHVVLENALMQHAPDNVRISSAYAQEPGALLEYTTRANRIARIEDRELSSLANMLKFS